MMTSFRAGASIIAPVRHLNARSFHLKTPNINDRLLWTTSLSLQKLETHQPTPFLGQYAGYRNFHTTVWLGTINTPIPFKKSNKIYESTAVYRDELTQQYLAGQDVLKMLDWLAMHGVQTNRANLRMALRQWGLKYDPRMRKDQAKDEVEDKMKRHKILHVYREALTEQYLAGRSSIEMLGWLAAQGVQTSKKTLYISTKEWGLKRKNVYHKPDEELEEHKEDLTEQFCAGRSVDELSNWLAIRGIEASPERVYISLTLWKLMGNPRRDIDAGLEIHKEAITQQFYASRNSLDISQWLADHGIDVSQAKLVETYKKWGLSRKMTHTPRSEALEPHKEALIQLHHGGASYHEIGQWLQERDVVVPKLWLRLALKYWEALDPSQRSLAQRQKFEHQKQIMLEQYRSGATVRHIQDHLRSQGYTIGIDALCKTLRTLIASEPYTVAIGAQEGLELYKETLIYKHRHGTAETGLQKWLKDRGIEVEIHELNCRLADWGLIPHPPDVPQFTKDVTPYKEELIRMYRDGLGSTKLRSWLTTKCVTITTKTLEYRLKQWGAYEGVRKNSKRKDLTPYKTEMIRRYEEGATGAMLAKWLEAKNVHVCPTFIMRNLRKWGVKSDSVDRHKETIVSMCREGKSLADIVQYLASKKLNRRYVVVRRFLREWGFYNVAGGPGETTEYIIKPGEWRRAAMEDDDDQPAEAKLDKEPVDGAKDTRV